MSKTIYEILATTPHKDTQKLLVPSKDKPGCDVFIVTEEQIRWLQYHIAIGEFPHDGACIHKGGINTGDVFFKKDGRLTQPVDGNTMSLNDDLTIALFTHYLDKKWNS